MSARLAEAIKNMTRTAELKATERRVSEAQEKRRKSSTSLFEQLTQVAVDAGKSKLDELKQEAAPAATSGPVPDTKTQLTREIMRRKRKQSQRLRGQNNFMRMQRVEMQKEMAKERAEMLKKQAKEEMLAQQRAEQDARKELSVEARQKICREKRRKIKQRLAECRKELEELQAPKWDSIKESLAAKKARERKLLDLWLAEMRMIVEIDVHKLSKCSRPVLRPFFRGARLSVLSIKKLEFKDQVLQQSICKQTAREDTAGWNTAMDWSTVGMRL
eukprot:g2010.t1